MKLYVLYNTSFCRDYLNNFLRSQTKALGLRYVFLQLGCLLLRIKDKIFRTSPSHTEGKVETRPFKTSPFLGNSKMHVTECITKSFPTTLGVHLLEKC